MSSFHVEPFYDPATFTLTFVVADLATKDAVVIDPVLDYDPASGTTSTTAVDQVSAYLRATGCASTTSSRPTPTPITCRPRSSCAGGSTPRSRSARASARSRRPSRGIFDLPTGFATDGSQFDKLLADGEVVKAGTLAIEVIATPGHTPACVTFKIGDAIFTGDALFTEDYGTGRCDFPRGSAADLYDSIQKLYALPDATRVFVGHDYQPGGREVRWQTTIGASKAHNPQLDATTTARRSWQCAQARDATLAAPRLLFPSVQVNIDAGRLPTPTATASATW
jgi:glyoxylase-like metal-dependent hydrolase (beta-lactamase superfamily II)